MHGGPASAGARSDAIVALADTGATVSVMPGAVLAGLGIQRLRRVSLVLADAGEPSGTFGRPLWP